MVGEQIHQPTPMSCLIILSSKRTIAGMGDSCSSEDAEKAALEIEADQPYEKLLEAITEELQESYKLIQKEYGEDRRRNKV